MAPDIFPRGLAGVVFDCDGVMIDSRDANRVFYNTVLAELNLPPMGPEEESYAFMATAGEALRAPELSCSVPPDKVQSQYHGEVR